jgi:NADH-quinone oxidoreductase subunit L
MFSVVYWVALLTAFMTAFYTGRAYFLTFWGPEKLPSPDDPEADPIVQQEDHSAAGHADAHDSGHGHEEHFGHESGPIMTVPLYVLAACAALAGIVFGSTGLFEHHLAKTFGFEGLGHVSGHLSAGLTPWIGTLAGILGIGLSYFLYANPSPIPALIASRLGPLYRASLGKFYVDEFYGSVVVRPTLVAAKAAELVDEYLIDGLVRLVSWIPRIVGRELLGPFQNGLIQFYAAVTALGVAALLWILLFN